MNSDSYQTEGTSKLCANDEENHGHVASPVSSNDQETTPLLSEPATRTRRDSMGDAIKHPYEIEGEEFWLSIQVECLVLCTDTRHRTNQELVVCVDYIAQYYYDVAIKLFHGHHWNPVPIHIWIV